MRDVHSQTTSEARPSDITAAGSPASEVTAWMADGSCRNYSPGVFFPSDGVGVDRARKICKTCPVTEPCLEYALEHRIDHGVWGGASERERRRILKRRRVELGVY
jgi:WhiB family redox-sensing transcriptional regulator